jgi:dTDP-4-amino-4,6-dideoxygalactose transaminase
MSKEPMIPFLDLVTPHAELEAELTAAFQRALKAAAFVGGPAVEGFEREFAAFCGVQHSVGVASGTEALLFALIALGVRPGETVLTVPNTFIATTEAISQAGAHPDFVDVDRGTLAMDPDRLRHYLESECVRDATTGRAISRRRGTPVTAVIPVHLYGGMADMDPILALAAEYGLFVIEDACQAHGAAYYSRAQRRWFKAGSMGHAAAFSFYPGKNLGACGEGGAVTTMDADVAGRCRMLRDHGQSKKYYHDIEGFNGRLDAIQAAILSIKLRHLAEWNDRRRALARTYDELFAKSLNTALRLCEVPEWSRPVYHLYVVRVPQREVVQRHLAEAGIGTAVHYPIPLHLSRAYASLGFRPGDFPVAEAAAAEILSLPMYPQLSIDHLPRIVTTVTSVVAGLNRLFAGTV